MTSKEVARVKAAYVTTDGDQFDGELVLREISDGLFLFIEDGHGNGISLDFADVQKVIDKFKEGEEKARQW